MEKVKTIHRTFRGVVVSKKMEKTIIVQVDRTLVHPKYGKRYIRSEKYHVHAENSKDFQEGSLVQFRECRPLSKTKRWCVIKT